MDRSPWKTPFGRLLIGSSIVAAVIGFALAAGMTTYFRSASASPADVIANGSNELDANIAAYPSDPVAGNNYADAPSSEVPTAEASGQDQYYSGSPDNSQEPSATSSGDDVQANVAMNADESADQGGTNQ